LRIHHGGGGFGYRKRRTLFKSQRDNRQFAVPGELKHNAGYLILRIIGQKTPHGLKGSSKSLSDRGPPQQDQAMRRLSAEGS
jgi:hypothetical protein